MLQLLLLLLLPLKDRLLAVDPHLTKARAFAEAGMRAADAASQDHTTTVEPQHLEKVLPQLVRTDGRTCFHRPARMHRFARARPPFALGR